jgi:hypothetical protein
VARRRTGLPGKPLRLVVTFPTGGAPDILARLFADKAQLGQPVVVENKPGAGGNIGADAVAKSAARRPCAGDGHRRHALDQRCALQQDALRHGEGLHPGGACGVGAQPAGRHPPTCR